MAFIDDDKVEELRRNFLVVDDGQRVLRTHQRSARILSSAASSRGSSFSMEYIRWMVLMQTWLLPAMNGDFSRWTL